MRGFLQNKPKMGLPQKQHTPPKCPFPLSLMAAPRSLKKWVDPYPGSEQADLH